LRLRLFSFRTYLFPAYFGVLGFHDVGRVWAMGEDSDTWHTGYGGGIWLAPFRQAVVSFMYGVSKADRVPRAAGGIPVLIRKRGCHAFT
jgi:hypothetical protein